MRIDNHETSEKADQTKQEIKNLLIALLNLQQKSHNRLIWMSALLLMNMSISTILVWFLL